MRKARRPLSPAFCSSTRSTCCRRRAERATGSCQLGNGCCNVVPVARVLVVAIFAVVVADVVRGAGIVDVVVVVLLVVMNVIHVMVVVACAVGRFGVAVMCASIITLRWSICLW